MVERITSRRSTLRTLPALREEALPRPRAQRMCRGVHTESSADRSEMGKIDRSRRRRGCAGAPRHKICTASLDNRPLIDGFDLRKWIMKGRNPDSLPTVNPPGDGGLKPCRAFCLRCREGGPLLADEVEVDLVAVGGQQGLDVDLVLGPEGDHLGEDQSFGSSHADSVALRPFQACGVGECSGVEGENRLEPVDSNTAERKRGHMLSDVLLDDDRWVERAASLDEVGQQSG